MRVGPDAFYFAFFPLLVALALYIVWVPTILLVLGYRRRALPSLSLATYTGLAAVFPAAVWLLYDLAFGYGAWLVRQDAATLGDYWNLIQLPLWIAFCGAVAGLIFGVIVKRSAWNGQAGGG